MKRSAARSEIREAAVDEPDSSDPHQAYGWRYAYETAPDGSERLVQVALTYGDLLDPQEGDFIASSTIHQRLIHDLFDVLRGRYQDEPTTAVWSDLKIAFVIPGRTAVPDPILVSSPSSRR